MKLKEIFEKMNELEDHLFNECEINDFVKNIFFGDGSGQIVLDHEETEYFSFDKLKELKNFLKKDISDFKTK